VILCAGAIHTPAILLRSGIGPADELRRLGITVTADLAGVGRRLTEHPSVFVDLELRPEARAVSVDQRHSAVVVRSSSGDDGSGENDMIVIPNNLRGYDADALGTGCLYVGVYESWSEGSVMLRSADPADDPVVELRMLTDERDLRRLRDGARRLFELCASAPFQRIARRVLVDDDGRTPGGDDRALDAWMRGTCTDHQHPAGTCRMGDPSDPATVVGPDCRVVGIERLRVADAAVMPASPRANTHLTCVAIGEHAAALIRRGRP
jgi:choline dehydrogenase